MTAAERPLRVGIRCDAGPTTGAGHVMRCIALAEEMAGRAWEVVFLSDLGGLEFPAEQLARRGFRRLDPPATPAGHLAAVQAGRLDAVVLDSYTLAPEVSAELVAAGVPVLAVVDGSLRGQSAHLYLDSNVGAELDDVALPAGAARCAGLRFSLQRDAIRRLRPLGSWRPRPGEPPRVVVAFGGTDAYGLAEATVAALAAAPTPSETLAVVPDEGARARVARMAGPRTQIRAVGPVADFGPLLASADLVVGAAGVSASEYCCLGRAAAVVAVADNQAESYARLVALGAVLGLGAVAEVRADPAGYAARLAGALADEDARAAAAAVAHGLVDGDGRARVVDALAEAVSSRPEAAGRR